MKKQQKIKRVNLTFSIPTQVSQDLHIYVKQREMNEFVSESLIKELKLKKDELRQCYVQANEDQGQLEALQDWEHII